jgi:hypothetical protein
MASTEHATPTSAPNGKPSGWFDFIPLIVAILFGIAHCSVAALAGWALAGWVGLILGFIAAIVAIPVVSIAVWGCFLLLIKLMIFVFSIGPDDLPREPREALVEGDELAALLEPASTPRSHYRPVLVIAVTLVLWVIFGLPLLSSAATSREFWDRIPLVVVIPLGFVAIVARHWLMALAGRFGYKSF